MRTLAVVELKNEVPATLVLEAGEGVLADEVYLASWSANNDTDEPLDGELGVYVQVDAEDLRRIAHMCETVAGQIEERERTPRQYALYVTDVDGMVHSSTPSELPEGAFEAIYQLVSSEHTFLTFETDEGAKSIPVSRIAMLEVLPE